MGGYYGPTPDHDYPPSDWPATLAIIAVVVAVLLVVIL